MVFSETHTGTQVRPGLPYDPNGPKYVVRLVRHGLAEIETEMHIFVKFFALSDKFNVSWDRI